ncbi:hypothetical protein H6784_03465 [Candidatus Nomurabacteria bacterium]|nr:hypothetical protein [Candidatus Kaiserbacteria bacterium]MCB9811114.1 hypothetical protein [Candidatus Nomurabacteria bacterium]MCB9814450.1 hypothetical protein [Candidatus Nomurabacteria bacterium]
MLQTSQKQLLPDSMFLSVNYWGIPGEFLQDQKKMKKLKGCLIDVLSKRTELNPDQIIFWAGKNLSLLNRGVKVEITWDDRHPADKRMTDPEIISCIIWAISRSFGQDKIPGELSMLNVCAIWVGAPITWVLDGYLLTVERITGISST